MSQTPDKWSENKLDKVMRSKDVAKYYEESFEELSEGQKRQFWNFLDNDLDTYSPKNVEARRKAYRKAKKAHKKNNERKV